jgi:peptidoglycan/xylan/chitin deacetylase (PgdA/CDA1 family)
MGVIKRALRALACLLGVHVVTRWYYRHHLLIVNYHGLRADESPRRSWLLLPHSAFSAQLDYLAAHYRIVPLDVALSELWSTGLREPTASITFDDGYRNNLTIGLPELTRRGFASTIYLATGLIGTDARLWTTELQLLIERTPATSIDLTPVGLGVHALGTPKERAATAFAANEALKLLPYAERVRALAGIRGALGTDAANDDGAFALLDWDEVRQMGATGQVTFGGHTVHHEILSQLSDESVTDEVAGSVAATLALGSAASRTFAYPNGRWRDFDARTISALRTAGATAAVTTVSGLNAQDTDRYALRRVVVGDRMALADFKLKTSGFTSALRRLVGLPLDA